MLELAGVAKRFGGVQALEGIDLEIGAGEIHALVGENGAGKSTLGKIIAGVHPADDGELRVDGRAVSYHSPRAALGDGLTMIAQEISLVPQRSVIENVFLGRESRRGGFVSTRRLRRRWSALEERTGFGIPPDALAGQLRLADQQKVEILRAIAREARLIVFDEPTAALAADESERLFQIIRTLREQGTAVVYVSHFLEEVLALVDRVTVLKDGRLIRTGAAADETPAKLVTAMLGRSLDLTFPDKRFPEPGAPAMLTVRGLSSAALVDDVSFEVRAGEIVALAGLVGSGRSEVARAIFGADKRTAGEILLAGEPVAVRSPREAIRKGIALLPESRKDQGLIMGRTVRENVTLPHLEEVSRGASVNLGRERRATQAIIDDLDVRGAAGAPVWTLSGGNQQKTMFAKWLLRPPKVLICDEPTRGVDVGAKLGIYELLARLAASGMAVLVISSEQEEVLGLAHRVLVMRGGRLVAELDGATATEEELMNAAFAAAPIPEEEPTCP
jgi:simple sugar transport system ATP-binding protein/ribose transport system ATP-binding protein